VRQFAFTARAQRWLGAGKKVAGGLVHCLQIARPLRLMQAGFIHKPAPVRTVSGLILHFSPAFLISGVDALKS
jgi:hypothetical protein